MTINIDIRNFYPVCFTDTCAIWNIVSAWPIYEAALKMKCCFSITRYVEYEVHKKWTKKKDVEDILKSRFYRARSDGQWASYSLTIEDLQDVRRLEEMRAISLGEISTIAFALKKNLAIITDDQDARRLAEKVLTEKSKVQTTPQLLGWIVFRGAILDSDALRAIEEHEKLKQNLRPHFERIFAWAQHCRRIESQQGEQIPA